MDPLPIPHLHAVVLAGGSGARFWPLSRELTPKQMLSIFGGESLITQAVKRVAPLLEGGALHVLAGETLRDELTSHLRVSGDSRAASAEILAEPIARNTAAAMALAAAHLLASDPDSIMIVLPSDHLLESGPSWHAAVALAVEAAEGGALVTIGLTPRTPETGYGYIRAGRELPGLRVGELAVRAVEQFVEKPDLHTAQAYLADGSYLWNSGMLVAKAASVLSQLRSVGRRQLTPDSSHGELIASTAERVAALPTGEWTSDPARELFSALPAVAFDKAVLEVSERVAVLPVDLAWSDVGSLLSLGELATPDARGNILVGHTVDVESRGVISYAPERLIATLGVSDLIVVDTADATLVAAKDRAQDVRLVVDALKSTGAREVVESRTAVRPWGGWTLLMRTDGFQIKSIDVEPGKRLSLQSHERRSEHWVVVEGRALVERDGEHLELDQNESVYICAGTRHRLANPGSTRLRVIEVAVGDYLGEDDITRYEDDWGREEAHR